MCSEMPERTACQRITKAALAQAMKEDVVGGLVEIMQPLWGHAGCRDINRAVDTIRDQVTGEFSRGARRVVILVIPEMESSR
jgi:hypothetical protein